MITGAQLFVKALREEQVDTLFAYPGGQAIDLSDALYGETEIEVILPRHEQGLVHAADGYACPTEKAGVCLVTSGSGATNLVAGIATANYDSAPLVCFTGQVSTGLTDNGVFQEVDITGITRSICKYAVTVRRRDELVATIKEAFYIARAGKPGVVVVDLPKDIQREYDSGECSDKVKIRGYRSNLSIHGGQIKKALETLNQAKEPVFLIGGGVNISHVNEEIQKLAELTGVPVVTTMMGKGTVPTTHKFYVESIGIRSSYAANAVVSRCDVLFSIGTRFNDRITGKIGELAPHAAIIHVDIDPASISRNMVMDIPIVADAEMTIQALLEKAKPLDTREWIEKIKSRNTQHPLAMKTEEMTPERIIREIDRSFDDAIIAADVGQSQLWAFQFLELNGKRQMLTSGDLGTMGYGFPAGIGAKLDNPSRGVIVIIGDGGIQMNIQEIATTIVYELPPIICIFNNGYLGNVRQWQELFFDRRYVSTCLRFRKSCLTGCYAPTSGCLEYTPDLVKLAESYGAKGIRVTREEEIGVALETAKHTAKVPTVIKFIADREENVISIVPPGHTIEDMMFYGEE